MKIGDRFAFYNDDEFIVEVVSLYGSKRHKLIVNGTNSHGYEVGLIDDWGDLSKEIWKYLGNFSKNKHFNNLYEKLSS